MKDNTPQAVQDAYEFQRWQIPQIDKFLPLRPFTLDEHLETSFQIGSGGLFGATTQ